MKYHFVLALEPEMKVLQVFVFLYNIAIARGSGVFQFQKW